MYSIPLAACWLKVGAPLVVLLFDHPILLAVNVITNFSQIPHIRSSYVAALGNELGLRGVEAALADYCRFQVSEAEKAAVKDTFAHLFDVDELINTIVEDINQQVFTFPLLSGLLSQV